MRRSIKIKHLLFCMTVSYSSWSIGSVCNNDEILLAECHINGGGLREASICSTADGETGKYVFKRNGTSEMTAVFNNDRKLLRWLDKGTYTTYFGFTNGNYVYVLAVPEENYGAKAFLNVKKDGKYIMRQTCDNNSFGDKTRNVKFINDVDDDYVFAHKGIFP